MEIDALLAKVTADPSFADRLKADPESALRSIGVEPTADLLEAVAESGDGEALAARISKAYRSGR